MTFHIKNMQQVKSNNSLEETTSFKNEKSIVPRMIWNKPFTLILILLLLLALGTAGFFYKQYTDVKNNPNALAAAETESLVKKVGVLIMLPKDETPTIATVNDKEKLKDQPFFKDANIDDKLLIYTNAKQAIIYRPSENKVINVGPIAISDGQ